MYQTILPEASGVYRSKVLDGLWIKVEWLWTRPTPLEVLQAWGMVAQAQ